MSSFGNFVQCQVSGPVTIDATAIDLLPVVAPYTLPPVGGGLLVLVDSPGNPSFIEVVRYSSRSGQQLQGVTRGQEGTVARAWSGTIFAFQSLMAGDFQTLLNAKQGGHVNLDALSGLTGAADRLPYFTGAGALSLATLTALARDLLDDTTQSGMQSTLGLVKQTSATDTTAGALMSVGAFGLGSVLDFRGTVYENGTPADFYGKGFINGFAMGGPDGLAIPRIPDNHAYGVLSGFGHWTDSSGGAGAAWREFRTSGGRVYHQTQSGGAWGAWSELFHTGNILGTVSQSAGVPTGALMERGSNGNGTYHRYADGTQITLRTIDYPTQAHATQGGIISVHSANFNGEYVVNITPETCIGSGNQSSIGALLYNGIYVLKSASYVSIDSYAYRVAVEVPVRLQVMCVGRWY